MKEIKNLGVITSGGDCGGLNGVIKGVASTAYKLGLKCFVIPNGYAGLYNLVDFDKLTELTPMRIDKINANLAGSEAGHSRVKVKKINDENKYDRIKKGLEKFKIDALVISGGDDTGSVVVDLLGQGIPCVHVPKTMDLDLQTYSVGGDSTVNRIATFADDLKTTGYTHNRIIALEVFGRYAGHTAFRGGIAADADAILIPEIPVDFDVLYSHAKARFIARVKDSDVNAGSYIIVVAEGLKDASGKEIVDEGAGLDAFGHKKLAGAGKYVSQELSKRFKVDPEVKIFMKEKHMFVEGIYISPEVREVTPGHLVRCGHSTGYDVNFGKESGSAAVYLIKKNITGVTVSGVCNNEIQYMPTEKAIQQRHVDLNQVALHESMGVCFGRQAVSFCPAFKSIEGSPVRYM
ncbi:Phosphofructokinase [Candidatus Omnitrophus magneticus]|uniref:Phosphofructokinase n=1 Tax=Candidatus Omnitrophus magneticus TaxID=1609969 RepID=A0A0F0CPQ9_9BACT|nr:Phosphofructokinase [Candidatus Omnitrophus magneticus]